MTMDSHVSAPASAADIEMVERELETSMPGNSDIENEAIDSRPLLRDLEEDEHELDDAQLLLKKDYEGFHPTQWRSLKALQLLRSRLIIVGLLSLAAVITMALLVRKFSNRRTNSVVGPYWNGFSNIDTYFAFGDSWTDTHFDPNGEQPSVSNPLGNPDFPGFTSSNGANYVGYLAAQHNRSFIKAYDMAFSGSTIDAEIDHPLMPWLDFHHQIRDKFMNHYTINETGTLKPLGWTSENTLFSMFFGINDIMVFNRSNPQFDHLFEIYENLIGELYDASARNFLILTIPALDRGPAVTERKPEDRVGFDVDVEDFNKRVGLLAQHVRRRYHGTTVFEYDVHDLFERIIDDPTSTKQTASYMDTTTRCAEYGFLEKGAIPTDEQIASCGGLQPDQYLWLNLLHITAPAHEAMAAEIGNLLVSATGN